MLVLPALVFLFLSPTFNGKSQNWPYLSCFLFYFILFQSFTLRSPGAALSRICLERASNVLIAICNILQLEVFSDFLHSLNFSCQNFVSCYFLFYFHPTFFFLKQQMPCWIDNNNTMLWPCSLCFYLSILISLCFHPTFLNNITMLVLPALVFLFLSPTFNGKSQNWPCLSYFSILFYLI